MLFRTRIVSESHAFLDGVLPEPYCPWSAPGDVAAFEDGKTLAGKYPEAECRIVPEDGTGGCWFEVHEKPPAARVQSVEELAADEVIHKRARRIAEERALAEELAEAEHEAKMAAARARLAELKAQSSPPTESPPTPTTESP